MVVNDVLMAEKEEEEDGGRGRGRGRGRGGGARTVDVGNGKKSNWFGCCWVVCVARVICDTGSDRSIDSLVVFQSFALLSLVREMNTALNSFEHKNVYISKKKQNKKN